MPLYEYEPLSVVPFVQTVTGRSIGVGVSVPVRLFVGRLRDERSSLVEAEDAELEDVPKAVCPLRRRPRHQGEVAHE